jgi:hypothetical protein
MRRIERIRLLRRDKPTRAQLGARAMISAYGSPIEAITALNEDKKHYPCNVVYELFREYQADPERLINPERTDI